jgi:restriction endonuclease Mrr
VSVAAVDNAASDSARTCRRIVPAAGTSGRAGSVSRSRRKLMMKAASAPALARPQAIEFVRHLAQRVILIDGQRLADLMIEHSIGVRLSLAIEIKRLDEDFFEDE